MKKVKCKVRIVYEKRIAAVILSMVLGAGMLAGCGQKNTTDADASSTTEVSADAEKQTVQRQTAVRKMRMFWKTALTV